MSDMLTQQEMDVLLDSLTKEQEATDTVRQKETQAQIARKLLFGGTDEDVKKNFATWRQARQNHPKTPIYKLSLPTKIDGQEITEICLVFDLLDRASLCMATEYAIKRGYTSASGPIEGNRDFLAYLAAEAASLAPSEINGLNARDFTQVCNIMKDYLVTKDYLADEPTKKPDVIEQIIELIESFEGLDRTEFTGRIWKAARDLRKELGMQSP